MRVVISHFFNEEYLLPWWLRHHREMFDHGVLIDYRSTDRSAEICRELVPEWDLVTSENEQFSAIMCDFEVMKHEQRFPGAWKIALNTTEFLMCPHLAQVEKVLIEGNITGCRMAGAIMIDDQPGIAADPDRPLVEQKASGVWEKTFNFAEAQLPGLVRPTRSRLYHRFTIGSYHPGRHTTNLPGIGQLQANIGAVWWYAYSPWTEAFWARKLQINGQRPEFDKRHGMGVNHDIDLARLLDQYARVSAYSQPLR